MTKRQIQYQRVSDVAGNPINPKDHDIGALHVSVDRFGFVEPIVVDERTGMLVSGHGRLQTLAQKEMAGHEPPDGIDVDEDGFWLIPVVTGWASRDDAEAEAFIIAANQLTTAGGWHDDALADVLERLVDGPGLDGVGFDEEDLEDLLKRLDGGGRSIPPDEFGEIDPDDMQTDYKCPRCQYEWSGKASS